jgi:diadenosine tetraphosphate (Ap4A) HIT family hydrolase
MRRGKGKKVPDGLLTQQKAVTATIAACMNSGCSDWNPCTTCVPSNPDRDIPSAASSDSKVAEAPCGPAPPQISSAAETPAQLPSSVVEIKSVLPKVNIDKIMDELEMAVAKEPESKIVSHPHKVDDLAALKSPTFGMSSSLPPKHPPRMQRSDDAARPKSRRRRSKPITPLQKEAVTKLFGTVTVLHRPNTTAQSDVTPTETKIISSPPDPRPMLAFATARAGDDGVLFAESPECPCSLVIAKCVPPRAPVHFLIVVRDLSLSDVSSLDKRHLNIVRKIESRGRLLLNLHCQGKGRIGFRVANEARFRPLHAHVIGGSDKWPFSVVTPQELIKKWEEEKKD